jgi:hypothetical protein
MLDRLSGVIVASMFVPYDSRLQKHIDDPKSPPPGLGNLLKLGFAARPATTLQVDGRRSYACPPQLKIPMQRGV